MNKAMVILPSILSGGCLLAAAFRAIEQGNGPVAWLSAGMFLLGLALVGTMAKNL